MVNTVRYVSPNGQDTNTGLSTLVPFKTINAALNATLNGDTLLLLPGAYIETDIVSNHGSLVATPMTIRAMIPGTVKIDGRNSATGIVLKIYGNYTNISDIEIQGDSTTFTGIQLSATFCSATRCYVHDLFYRNAPVGGAGIVVPQNNNNCLVYGNVIENIAPYNETFPSGTHGLYIQGAYSQCYNNIVLNSQGCGVKFSHVNVSFIECHNNLFHNCLYTGIFYGEAVGATITGCHTTNNVCSKTGNPPSFGNGGFHEYNSDGTTISGDYWNANVIVGNQIGKSTISALNSVYGLSDTLSQSPAHVIINTLINGLESTIVGVAEGTYMPALDIEGNTRTTNSVGPYQPGISVLQSVALTGILNTCSLMGWKDVVYRRMLFSINGPPLQANTGVHGPGSLDISYGNGKHVWLTVL